MEESYHLGDRIAEEIARTGISKAEFARRIGTSRQNVNSILNRRELPTQQLLIISKALRYNFFLELAALLPSCSPATQPFQDAEVKIVATMRLHPLVSTAQGIFHFEKIISLPSNNHFPPLFLDQIFTSHESYPNALP